MAKSTDPLSSLQRRIDAARSHEGEEKQDEPAEAELQGLRRISQLAGGLATGAAVGATCGYFLDRWLGLSPLFFITGFFLGFAAGVYNLMRSMED